MKRGALFIAALAALTTPAHGNDWEKFYTPIPGFGALIEATVDPEQLQSQGNMDADIDAMWRKGYAPVGYTHFNASNTKTNDGLKLAKKLKARYVVIGTQYTGTNTGSIPITIPNTSTIYSSGTASAYGSGGSASGTYSGTSTTYGSSTSYIPIAINRYDKLGIYFKEMPKHGIGAMWREPTPEEISRIETRRAVVVMSIRDGSPSYNADMLPGDIITWVNGAAADEQTWRRAMSTAAEVAIKFVRKGTVRELTIPIPADWRQ